MFKHVILLHFFYTNNFIFINFILDLITIRSALNQKLMLKSTSYSYLTEHHFIIGFPSAYFYSSAFCHHFI